MKNAKLMVSAMGNRIYLGTLKKNSPFPVMNESRVDFTDQCIRAMFQHMQGLPEGQDCYEMPGVGRLVLEPLPQAIETTEPTQAVKKIERMNPNEHSKPMLPTTHRHYKQA